MVAIDGVQTVGVSLLDVGPGSPARRIPTTPRFISNVLIGFESIILSMWHDFMASVVSPSRAAGLSRQSTERGLSHVSIGQQTTVFCTPFIDHGNRLAGLAFVTS